MYRLEGARDGFSMPFALRFTGQLDIAALAEALNDVVARHESLRTNFAEHEGVPYHIVHPTLQVELPVTRTSAKTGSTRRSPSCAGTCSPPSPDR